MGYTHGPEIVDQNIEDAQNDDQQRSTPLSLEADNDHYASDKPEQADQNPANRPLPGEDESDEQENKQNTASKLKVDLLVLLVDLGETSESKPLAVE
jgi:hypothetical protein